MEIKAPARLRLRLCCVEGASNSAEEMELRGVFFQMGKPLAFGEREKPRKIESFSYWPTFIGNDVAWSECKERGNPVGGDDLAERLVNELVRLIESERR